MKFELDLYAIIGCAALFQGVLIILFLATRRQGNRVAVWLLMGLIFHFLLKILLSVLTHTRGIYSLPYFVYTDYITGFVWGPLFYFYVRSLTIGIAQFRWKSLLHMIPAVLYLVLVFPFAYEDPVIILDHMYAHIDAGKNHSWQVYLVDFIVYRTHPLIYLLLSIRLLMRYSNQIRSYYSNVDQINLRWLKYTVWSFTIWAIGGTAFFFIMMGATGINLWSMQITTTIVVYSYFTFMLSYNGWRIPLLTAVNVPKDEKRSLDKPYVEKASELAFRLQELMVERELYKDPNLDLAKLANQADITVRQASYVINKELGVNFYDLVNGFRIEAAKTMLANPENQKFTVEALGYEVGFSTKDVFFRAFRKHTGTTPARYKKSRIENERV